LFWIRNRNLLLGHEISDNEPAECERIGGGCDGMAVGVDGVTGAQRAGTEFRRAIGDRVYRAALGWGNQTGTDNRTNAPRPPFPGRGVAP
jgi:hypothetical protein